MKRIINLGKAGLFILLAIIIATGYGGVCGIDFNDDDDNGGSSVSDPSKVMPSFPANGATNVFINRQLSWAASTSPSNTLPITYDVYFGAVNPPDLKVSTGQSGTSYNPGALNFNTTYYWMINSQNSKGTTSSDIWNFHTEGNITPTLTSPGNKIIDEYQTLTFTLIAFDTNSGDIIAYSMNTAGAGATINATTGLFNWTPDYTQSGNYSVTFRATDSGGLYNEETIIITVNDVDRPPVLISPGNKTVNENVLLTFTLSAADPDGDTLTYAMTLNIFGASLNLSTGLFNWTPDYTQSGSYNVIFTATANSLSDSETITIVVNDVLQLPAQVASPNPSNGATGVPVTPTLTWALASGATSYDVYFSTTTTGWSVITNTAFTSFSPSVLSYSTVYYWRIDSKNPYGTTAGNAWSFASQFLPARVLNPFPAIDTAGISTDTVLSWTSEDNVLSYDIYFGTNYYPLKYVTTVATAPLITLFNPGALNPDTRYFWRVDSINNTGKSIGSIWTFTTSSTLGYASGELLIKFTPDFVSQWSNDILAGIALVCASAGVEVQVEKYFSFIQAGHVKIIDSAISIYEGMLRLGNNSNVEYSEPNYIVYVPWPPPW